MTALGKRENCKIVAAKSTPLKTAIIPASPGQQHSSQLMRKAPLFWPLLNQVPPCLFKAHHQSLGVLWRQNSGTLRVRAERLCDTGFLVDTWSSLMIWLQRQFLELEKQVQDSQETNPGIRHRSHSRPTPGLVPCDQRDSLT